MFQTEQAAGAKGAGGSEGGLQGSEQPVRVPAGRGASAALAFFLAAGSVLFSHRRSHGHFTGSLLLGPVL